MRKRRLRTVLCAVALLAMPSLRATAQEQPSLADEVARLLPAVVEIHTMATTQQGTMTFTGSGFIIDRTGVIVTNRHVVAGSYEITADVPDFGRLKARPLYISEGIDLALVKVDAGRDLPTVKLGDSDRVRVGDRVMLVGDPLGVGESLSFGVVSGLNRDIGETMYDHFIQTDAALNHGNSGGAMFNLAGEVIAINTGLTSSPGNTGSIGIGYAMPINDAKFLIQQFMRDGYVIVGTLGLRGQRVTEDLAASFGLDGARGAIVTSVTKGGPSDGKILAGDIVLKVGAQEATDTRAVARLVAAAPPGQPIEVTLWRDRAQRTVTVIVAKSEVDAKAGLSYLGRAPEQAKLFATPSEPGMKLAPIDDGLRKKFALAADQGGVVVTEVDANGVASAREIVAGDLILAVDGKPVATPRDVQQRLHEATDRLLPFAALLIAGGRTTRWITLPLEPDR